MLSKDTRPIWRIVLNSGQFHAYFEVGGDSVTKISAVDETGEMAYIPWFEVWKENKLYARCNASYVSEVYYEEGRPGDDTAF